MSKLHVMELFARAKQQQQAIDKIVKGDSVLDVPKEEDMVEKKVEIEPMRNFTPNFMDLTPLEKVSFDSIKDLRIRAHVGTDCTTPEYMSEMSTISMLTEDMGSSFNRLVGSGGQYLALARPDGLWVIDMTTGLSNDASTRGDLCDNQITDLEVGKNFVLYTDGINVGVAKCSPGVDVNRVVYLANIGSEDDPVLHVKFHPVMVQFFVIVQKKKGWTLFDLSRLQLRTSGSSSIISDPPTEGSFAILDLASNPVIAGKKLSPGVLAILKRGTSPEPKQIAPDDNLVDFCFSADGATAAALLSSGLVKMWKIGHRCSTIESQKSFSLKNLSNPVKRIVAGGDTNLGIVTDTEYVEVDIGGTEWARISFADPAIQSVCSIGDHVRHFIVKTRGSLMSVFIDDQNKIMKSSVYDSSTIDLTDVRSMVTVQSVGRPNQFNTYFNGLNSENLLVWTAQTIDMDELRGSEIGFYGNGSSTPRDDEEDFIRSDASEQGPEEVVAPDHLQANIADVTEMIEHNQSFATFVSSIREDQESHLRQLKSEMAELVEKEISRSIKQMREAQKTDRRNEISLIRSDTSRIIREKFKSAMTRTFAEIENQVVKNVSAKIDQIGEKLIATFASQSSSSSAAVINRIDNLTSIVDQELARLRSGSVGPSGQPMSDIRRHINNGDHARAIEVAVHWWKSQTSPPVEDLLAITCAAIASQLKPAEPLPDVEIGCYVLLVLTEWIKANASAHADRTVAVLRASRYIVGCLIVSPMSVVGEALELCSKSLSKSLRNIASGAGSSDRTVEDQSRDLLTDIREVMMKFNIKTPSRSRDATPRTSLSPGTNILQMLQQAASRR